MARKEFLRDAASHIAIPPTLPHPTPTTAAWQDPPHPVVGNAKSANFPEATDIVVIGSGITGISVARSLLTRSRCRPQPLRVTILEARTAVSGATGRNGGHLVSDSEAIFPSISEKAGVDHALAIARFSEANIHQLRQLAASLPPNDREAAELRDLHSGIGIEDPEVVKEVVKVGSDLRGAMPGSSIDFVEINHDEAVHKLGFHPRVAGAVQQRNVAALWPYRLLTAVLAQMVEEFKDRFTLETYTCVHEINHRDDGQSHPYTLVTPRGTIRAKQVVHCTNGYAAALIPGLTGKLYPLRGTMSTQRPTPEFGNAGSTMSWSHLSPATYDPKSGHVHLGLYYAQQNPYTGHIFLGGESQHISGLLNSDDSIVADDACRTLCAAPARIWDKAAPSESLKVWSGIMGFTGDGLPLVGQLDASLTRRPGAGEFIAAGYNGHGMDKAWLCGQEVARLVLGEVEEDIVGFPSLFRLSSDRVVSWTPFKCAESLADGVMMTDNMSDD